MLQDIRQGTQGTAAKIIIGLIVLSFALFGIQSILLDGGRGTVAEVNGEAIGPEELQQAINTHKRRLISMMGENLDPSMLDDERIAGQALEALVGRKVLVQSAEQMDLSLSETEIGLMVAGMEQFQIEGQFSPEAYKSALATAGYTPTSFKQALRDDVLINQLRSGIAGSDFATPAELALNARIMSEQRDIQYLTVPRENFEDVEAPSNEDIQAWYDSHQQDFRAQESVDLDYVEIALEDFFQPVAEEAVLAAYETVSQDYQYQTRNRVSHILLEEGGDRPVAERLLEVQAQLASGEDFAAVATAFSDDIGSSATGGDLGYTSGDAFPAEMEAAIAILEPGVVSEPVETEAGVHLILVTERSEGNPPSLEELRPQLEQSVQREEAAVELLRTVESLRDLTFNADDLKSPASELGLAVATLDGVTRAQREGLMANAALLEAAFSEEVLVSGHNSDVIEIGSEHYVALRVREHHPSEVQPLDVVREQVVAAINDSRARAALDAEAIALLERLRDGDSLEKLAAEKGYVSSVELAVDRRSAAVPFEVLEKAFELPSPMEGQEASDILHTQSGDAMIVSISNVIAGDFTALEAPEQQQLRQQTTSEFGVLVNTDFERNQRDSAEISTVL